MVSELRTQNSELKTQKIREIRENQRRKNRCACFFIYFNNRSDWYYNYKFPRETAAFEFDIPEVKASMTTAIMPAFCFSVSKYLGNIY